MQESWTHWTRYGVFELKQDRRLGGFVYDLYFRGSRLDTFFHTTTAIECVQNGAFDDQLGSKGASFELPTSVESWNNLK